MFIPEVAFIVHIKRGVDISGVGLVCFQIKISNMTFQTEIIRVPYYKELRFKCNYPN